MITLIIVAVLWMGAAICNGVMDVLAFKFKTSIFRKLNEDFWNPSKSWRNKYKNKNVNEGPAFLGSTTVFSFVTDAWHLFQFLTKTCIETSLTLLFSHIYCLNWWQGILLFFGFKIVWGILFELFFSKFFRKR